MRLLEIKALSHTFDGSKLVLKNIDLELNEKEVVVVVGPSGVGKSTLLYCVNRLVQPTEGSVKVLGREVVSANRTELREIRRSIGMIFQQFNLFDRQTVTENVLLGRLGYINSWKGLLYFPELIYSRSDFRLAKEALSEVGLEEFANKKVGNLSGGQKQRVAIAKTLVQQPRIILADEPVSSLDPYLAEEIMALLASVAHRKKIAVFTSLHSLPLAKKYADRIIGLSRGKMVYQGKPVRMTKKIIEEIYGKEFQE
jgi:phosphonate transport system ATP-binding protein